MQLLREQKRTLVSEYARPNDLTALVQVLVTLIGIVVLWWLAVASLGVSRWLLAGTVLALSLFTLRVFALMHECGHGSLFRSGRLNRLFGFLLGVVAGMPQYVWSRHHAYHHTHNGNWQKYRGPYTTRSVNEYDAMTVAQRFLYRSKCSIGLAPVVGFVYLIFNPRYTWLRGTASLLIHQVKKKAEQPELSLREHAASFRTRYWQSRKEYWHMFWNNAVLLSVWAAMSVICGPMAFFTIYVLSVSLAGGAGIVLFTVQHNFEHAYASDDEHWEYDRGAINGTSFLMLPRLLNWFTANIGYHHIHHLSPQIPNYRLVECHNQYRHLFETVQRVRLSGVPKALQCILWDSQARRIISLSEYASIVLAVPASMAGDKSRSGPANPN